MRFTGLSFVIARGGPLSAPGRRIHLVDSGAGSHDPALCKIALGSTSAGWRFMEREAFAEALLCRKCAERAEWRIVRAAKRQAREERDELYDLRRACVAAGQLKPRDSHRTAAVRLADAEARWNQRHKVAR